jgi:uncharacterized membrane protein (UPF0127 family)
MIVEKATIVIPQHQAKAFAEIIPKHCLLLLILNISIFSCQSKDLNQHNKQSCELDADCVASWWVGSQQCGSIDRCLQSECQPPLALTGQSPAGVTIEALHCQITRQAWDKRIEWARGEFALTRGLMCRPSMHRDWVMILDFAQSQSQSITSHLMQFPLLLLALSSDNILLGFGILDQSNQSWQSPDATKRIIEYPLIFFLQDFSFNSSDDINTLVGNCTIDHEISY